MLSTQKIIYNRFINCKILSHLLRVETFYYDDEAKSKMTFEFEFDLLNKR